MESSLLGLGMVRLETRVESVWRPWHRCWRLSRVCFVFCILYFVFCILCFEFCVLSFVFCGSGLVFIQFTIHDYSMYCSIRVPGLVPRLRSRWRLSRGCACAPSGMRVSVRD